VTATWGILMGDLSGWAQSRGERRRLAGVVAALIAGALFGGLLMLSAVRDWVPVFPLAVSAGVVTAAALIFHRVRAPAGPASRSGASSRSRAGQARISSHGG
jgi:CHASE2 domain-containing sensor protein